MPSVPVPDPNTKDGIEYWKTQPADLDGVLGGFGSGSLPRVDALGSRKFLQSLIPELCTVPSAIRPLSPVPFERRPRSLDVGAGIGRVTSDVLLHLFSDVVLLEPVEDFIRKALESGQLSAEGNSKPPKWKGISDGSKSVTFLKGTLQDFLPADPLNSEGIERLGRVGYKPSREEEDDIDSLFDVVWCQWCLGHLSDKDLVSFLKRSYLALRNPGKGRSLIIVKENLCSSGLGGSARTVFDEQDSSLTRSDAAWKAIFKEAGLKLIDEKTQLGLPPGLYEVKMYALK